MLTSATAGFVNMVEDERLIPNSLQQYDKVLNVMSFHVLNSLSNNNFSKHDS
jgi:hypothetical protein